MAGHGARCVCAQVSATQICWVLNRTLKQHREKVTLYRPERLSALYADGNRRRRLPSAYKYYQRGWHQPPAPADDRFLIESQGRAVT